MTLFVQDTHNVGVFSQNIDILRVTPLPNHEKHPFSFLVKFVIQFVRLNLQRRKCLNEYSIKADID